MSFALANQHDYKGARPILSRLAQAATNASVKQAAIEVLAQIDLAQQQEAASPVAQPAVSSTSAPSSSAPTPGGTRLIPVFRKIEAGETSVAGWLTSIECDARGITFQIKGRNGPFSLHASRFDDVEFISYREDRRGTVSCGARADAEVVIATYKPRREAGSHPIGDAVALEFPPPEYEPK